MDESRIIAWIDGALSSEEAAQVEAAVAASPDLTAMANRHRRIRARFKSTFTPLLTEAAPPRKRKPAQVVSLAAVREQRSHQAVPQQAEPQRRNWIWPGAVAAAMLIGVLAGQEASKPVGGVADRNNALALAAPIAQALATQTSGDLGTVNVAVSFKDHDGRYCRSFVAQYIRGIACKTGNDWLLRYGAPVDAGNGPVSARIITTMIVGAPLDPQTERQAIATGWR